MKILKSNKVIFVIILFIVVFALVIELIRIDVFLKVKQEDTLEKSEIEIKQVMVEDYDVEKFMIIVGSDIEELKHLEKNVVETVKYMKCDYQVIKASQVTQIPDEYDGVIYITENIEAVEKFEEIFDYVYKGGNLLIPNRLELSSGFRGIYRELGILEFGGFEESTGLVFEDDFIINSTKFESDLSGFITNSSVAVQVNSDAEVSIRSSEGINLFWNYQYGRGNIGYFNGDMMYEKSNRAMILGAINSVRDHAFYPIINSKIMYIDDFPAPVPDRVDDKIYEEFSRNIRKFYKEIWWPDMVEIGAREALVYTGVVIGSYEDKTHQLEEDDLLLDSDILLYYGKELLNRDGEVGVHGFNHQPLLKYYAKGFEGIYNKWTSDAEISLGYRRLDAFIKEILKVESVVTYVPPSNILDESSRKLLIDEGVLIIASLYSDEAWSDTYIQEFEVRDGIVELPRVTSGYNDTEVMRWLSLNSISLHGVYSHFVHPDDVFDSNRSNDAYWSTMYEKFTSYNKFINKNYPWLEAVTASNAARQLIRYNSVIPVYEEDEKEISIISNGFIGPYDLVYQTQSRIAPVSGCDLEKIDSNKYLIRILNEKAKVEILDE